MDSYQDDARAAAARRGRWSTEEVARFKALYGLKEEVVIARELGRSITSIRNMARQIFDGPPRTGPWTAAEIASLKRYLGASPVDTIARILARPREEVQAQIVELARVKRSGGWSAEELAQLKRLYGTRTDEDLAILLGRKLEDIQQQAVELCLSKDKAFLRKVSGGKGSTRMPRWTGAELEVLHDLYPRQSNLEIAKKLNRSVKSVVSKAHHLGLKKDPARLKEMGQENVRLRYDRQGE